MFTLDTNAIIYYYQRKPDVVPILRDILSDENISVSISAITEAELFGYSKLTTEEIEIIEDILQTLHIVPINSRIARLSGSIRAAYNVKLADSIVAATTLATGTTLITRNVKDFKKVPNLNEVLRKGV